MSVVHKSIIRQYHSKDKWIQVIVTKQISSLVYLVMLSSGVIGKGILIN